MKKLLVLIAVVLLVTACGSKDNIVGRWVSTENASYEFYEGDTCKKNVNGTDYSCTYSTNSGVVDIELEDGSIESGQINSDCIIVGSDLYNKAS